MRTVVVGTICTLALALSGCLEAPWPDELVEKEDAMRALVNEVRATGATCPESTWPAVGAVVDDPALRDAARAHAKDMAENDYFAHDAMDGRDPFERMEGAGYSGEPRAENIAAGSETAEDTFAQWMTSEGHCQNILLSSTNELGVGVFFVEGSTYGWYWVQNFGEGEGARLTPTTTP